MIFRQRQQILRLFILNREGGFGLRKNINLTNVYRCTCTKSGRWAAMHSCVRGIMFAGILELF